MKREIERNPDAPSIAVPLLRMSAVKCMFTLADITDTEPFRRLGHALASNPDGELVAPWSARALSRGWMGSSARS